MSKILELSVKDVKELSYEEFVALVSELSWEDVMKLSRKIGYPVFNRMCMGELKHKFVLLQDGAAAAIYNDKGELLFQRRADRDVWGLPGGCQEVGERFEEVVLREIKEETNLDVMEKDLELIGVVSGMSRLNSYPNGDIVINNTVLYGIGKYTGELKWNYESRDMKFFPIDRLPEKIQDRDLVDRFCTWVKTKKR